MGFYCGFAQAERALALETLLLASVETVRKKCGSRKAVRLGCVN